MAHSWPERSKFSLLTAVHQVLPQRALRLKVSSVRHLLGRYRANRHSFVPQAHSFQDKILPFFAPFVYLKSGKPALCPVLEFGDHVPSLAFSKVINRQMVLLLPQLVQKLDLALGGRTVSPTLPARNESMGKLISCIFVAPMNGICECGRS